MKSPLKILFFVCLLLASFNAISQEKCHIIITYVSCFSTFETVITETEYRNLGTKDSLLISDIKKINHLKKLLKVSKVISLREIDFRIKVEFYKLKNLMQVYYFDNEGFYYENGLLYKPNKLILNEIKKLAPKIDCWN